MNDSMTLLDRLRDAARLGASALAQVAPPVGAGAPPPATGAAPSSAPASQPGGSAMLMQFALPILIFVGFYFLLIRPQSAKAKELDNKLKRGDRVVTQSGIVGVIDAMTEKVVTLEIAKNVKIQVLRASIASPFEGEGTSKNIGKPDDAKSIEKSAEKKST